MKTWRLPVKEEGRPVTPVDQVVQETEQGRNMVGCRLVRATGSWEEWSLCAWTGLREGSASSRTQFWLPHVNGSFPRAIWGCVCLAGLPCSVLKTLYLKCYAWGDLQVGGGIFMCLAHDSCFPRAGAGPCYRSDRFHQFRFCPHCPPAHIQVLRYLFLLSHQVQRAIVKPDNQQEAKHSKSYFSIFLIKRSFQDNQSGKYFELLSLDCFWIPRDHSLITFRMISGT